MSEDTAPTPRRLKREERTISEMIALFCRHHHAGRPRAASDERLCRECAGLLDYARLRLEKCRYGAGKPTCADCATHCYKPAMREHVREVMRYSGPRMITRHPVLAVSHLVDGRRATPEGSGRRSAPPEGPDGG